MKVTARERRRILKWGRSHKPPKDRGTLTPKQFRVWKARAQKVSYGKIAEQLEVSRQRVRQLEVAAYRRSMEGKNDKHKTTLRKAA